jgi:hypothetical protein
MLGSTARQSHTADTFALGLCMVHMLTGEEPYEVLLKDVLCPKPLVNKLKKVWHITEPHNDSSPFTVIKDVIDSLDEEADDDCPGAPPVKEVLAHTLYRYLVMFAASPDFASGFVENDLYKKNDVWNAINEVLDLQKFVCEFPNGKYCIGGAARSIAVRKQFEDNVRKWSIHQGSSEQMTR